MAIFASALAGIGGLIAYATWRNHSYNNWRKQIDTSNVLFYTTYWEVFQFTVESPGMPLALWQKNGLLVISHKRIALYQQPQLEPVFTIQPHELRGFWRPQKYSENVNEIWIHAQIGLTWYVLKLRLHKSSMQAVVRSVKAIATEEQIKAYRRARPYIHRESIRAFPAQQNLHGAWELDAPVDLYLMPLMLVIFQGNEVHDTLELATIQNIAALWRMEGGKPDGLVRFNADDVTYAFALDEYETWAADLAEAAKRTLEDPLERKRKSKDDDEDVDE
jgi:hypothetical protein